MIRKNLLACAAGLLISGSVSAALVTPASYDMLNGDGQAHGGSFNYWDRFYTGSGCTNCDRSPLTGGLGDLTDGVTTNQNWNLVENVQGTGPYVGWLQDPTITFHFAQGIALDKVTLHLDDANGFGGVSAPLSATLSDGNTSITTLIGDQPGAAPFSFDLATTGLEGKVFTLSLQRGNGWVFMDEVTFDGRPCVCLPEPGGLALLGLGLGVLGYRRRSRA